MADGVDLDNEGTQDEDWTVVTRKNNRNTTYYVHINRMYTQLPDFSAPLNPQLESKILVQHFRNFT